MAINEWPEQERPREKLIRFGANTLSEAELLAIFLQTGVKGKTALDIARDLLKEYKSLRCLLSASQRQISTVHGIGKAKFSLLQAALELGRRQLEEELKQMTPLTSAKDAKNYLIAKLSNYKFEVFACIFLNTRHQIIKYEELFHGTLHCTPIYPRIVAQKGLEYNAGALILAHNHPSGRVYPSQNDITSTQDLITALNYLDIRVLDHIIIGGNKCFSLVEQGLI
jgi:DNA repair protein RadC